MSKVDVSSELNAAFSAAMGKKMGEKQAKANNFLSQGERNEKLVENDEALLAKMSKGLRALTAPKPRDPRNIQHVVQATVPPSPPAKKPRGRPPKAEAAPAAKKAASPRFKSEDEELLAKAKLHLQITELVEFCKREGIDLNMRGTTISSDYEAMLKHRAQIYVRIDSHSAKDMGKYLIDSAAGGVEPADQLLRARYQGYRQLGLNLHGFNRTLRSGENGTKFERLKEYLAIKHSPKFTTGPETAMVVLFTNVALQVSRDNAKLEAAAEQVQASETSRKMAEGL